MQLLSHMYMHAYACVHVYGHACMCMVRNMDMVTKSRCDMHMCVHTYMPMYRNMPSNACTHIPIWVHPIRMQAWAST